MTGFSYDIALSFLSEDEGIAMQLNDLLQDRYKTFVYSQRQKELAGTDGERTFNEVFSQEARTVAVLYRPGWGQTPWTRIEETAIRNRAHDQGYDFATFISMLEPVQRPQWLPKARLLYVLNRFGVAGAAAALDARIQDQGGDGREESVLDRATRLKRAQDFAARRQLFLTSELGVKAAKAAYDRLIDELKNQSAALGSAGIKFEIQDFPLGYTTIGGRKIVMLIYFNSPYVNSLHNTILHVEFYVGFPKLPGIIVFDDPQILEKSKFKFDLSGPDSQTWVGNGSAIPVNIMSNFLAKRFMDYEDRQRDAFPSS